MTATIAKNEKDMATRTFTNPRKYEKLRVDAELINFIGMLGDVTVSDEFDMYELPNDEFIIEKEFNGQKVRIVSVDSKIMVIHISSICDNNTTSHVFTIDWRNARLTFCTSWDTDIMFELANSVCRILGAEPFGKKDVE